MSTATLTWKGDEFLRKLHGPGGAVDIGLTAAVERLHNKINRSMGRAHGGTASKPGGYPHTQSGQFRAQLSYTQGRAGSAYVNNFAPYARILEKGGVIRPRRSKWLCWPVGKAAKKATKNKGSQSYAIALLKQTGKMVRIPLRSGGFMLGMRVGGKNARIEPMFIMKRQTYIAPRPWATLGLRDARGEMRAAFVREAGRAMKATATPGGVA